VWTYSGGIGTENAYPRASSQTDGLVGEYDVDIFYPNHEDIIFQGTLTIKNLGKDTYNLYWEGTNPKDSSQKVTKYVGIGLTSRQYLVASYWVDNL